MAENNIPLEQYVGAKLYYELGLAITQWAHVQDSLLRVFNKLMGEENYLLYSVIFYAPVSEKVRTDIVDNTAKVVLSDSELFEEWEKLRRQVDEKGKKRNILAHLMALHHAEYPEKSVLRPHLFNATILYKNKPMSSYTAKDIKNISQSFGRLSQDLEDFAQKILPPSKLPQQPGS